MVGDLLLVVERDNARVQVLRLPGFEPVASFGRETLRRPYGIAVLERSATEMVVFVSDDYRALFFWDPPDRQLGERVKRYRLTVGEAGVEATYLGGTTVRNTDGLALTQRPVGSMATGVLYAVHDDRALGAVSWADLARSLELGDPCPVP